MYSCPGAGAPCQPGRIQAPPDSETFLLLFGTGIRFHTLKPAATINGVPAEVVYSNMQGEFVGLDQVNVRVPTELLGTGRQELVLRIGTSQAKPVIIHF